MRVILASLFGVVLMLLLAAAPVTAKAVGEAKVELEPRSVDLGPPSQVVVGVRLDGTLTCTAGANPPSPVDVIASKHSHSISEGYLWRLSPEAVTGLGWRKNPTLGEDVYELASGWDMVAYSETQVDDEVWANLTVFIQYSVGPNDCATDGFELQKSDAPFTVHVLAKPAAKGSPGPGVALAILAVACALASVRRARSR